MSNKPATLNDGHGNKCTPGTLAAGYTMQLSNAFNQVIWQMSGRKQDQKLHDEVTRLMAITRGEARTANPQEFVLHRAQLMTYYIEWFVGMLSGPDSHKVLCDNPEAFMAGFRNLCLEMADVMEGPAAADIKKALAHSADGWQEHLNNEAIAKMSQSRPGFTSPPMTGFGNNPNLGGAGQAWATPVQKPGTGEQ